MILFNDAIEVFPPNHFDQGRTTKVLEHLVDRLDASSVHATFADDDFARQSVHLERTGGKLRRSGFVPALEQHEILGLAALVDSSKQINPVALHTNVSFVQSPRSIAATFLAACLVSNQCGILDDPTVQCRVIDGNTTLRQIFFRITIQHRIV